MKRALLLCLATLGLTSAAPGAVVITQYYEGASFNKWIELTNLGSTSEDLSLLTLTLWSNANTEAWRTSGTPSQSLTLSGTLGAGQSFLLSHSSAALPTYATADLTSGSVINFNGDDSVVLYSGSVDLSNIVDALSFTDAGAEGTNTSLVRIDPGQGYSLAAGSTYQDFPGIWQQVATDAVDGALPGMNERLGVSTIPEPSTALLALLGLLALGRRR